MRMSSTIPPLLLTLTLFVSSGPASAQCAGFAAGENGGQPKIYSTTGNPKVDKTLNDALGKMWAASGQKPKFYLFDDGGDRHAAFADTSYSSGRWKGAVCVGKTTVAALEKNYQNWDIVLLAVIAHELAHIAQHNTAHPGEKSLYSALIRGAGDREILAELHADFMAGYYIGWLKTEVPRISTAGVDLFMCEIGQHDSKRVDYHGSKRQRQNAYTTGYQLGTQRAKKFPGAMDDGVEFVVKQFTNEPNAAASGDCITS